MLIRHKFAIKISALPSENNTLFKNSSYSNLVADTFATETIVLTSGVADS